MSFVKTSDANCDARKVYEEMGVQRDGDVLEVFIEKSEQECDEDNGSFIMMQRSFIICLSS